MIRAKNVYKTFGKLQVLKGVDLQINKGEIVSIVGISGAGKTTLLHILGTLENPDKRSESELIINGTDIFSLSDKKLSRFRNKHLGFVFQFHQLLPEFTALENVCIPAYINNTSQAAAEKRAKELLDFLGLADKFDKKPGTLSGGEQQRVAVARSLINQPEIIFADEPTGNLDSENAQQLHDLFIELRDTMGQTFVIVTHNDELAMQGDRKLTMVDGKFIADD